MLYDISIFYAIVEKEIMIHKFMFIKHFLSNNWNYI